MIEVSGELAVRSDHEFGEEGEENSLGVLDDEETGEHCEPENRRDFGLFGGESALLHWRDLPGLLADEIARSWAGTIVVIRNRVYEGWSDGISPGWPCSKGL